MRILLLLTLLTLFGSCGGTDSSSSSSLNGSNLHPVTASEVRPAGLGTNVLGWTMDGPNGTAMPRIINGDLLTPSQWLYVVNIMVGTTGCSGTVVGPRAVLMAAHCGVEGAAANVTINNGSGKVVTGKIERSPLYPGQDVDVGLVILDNPLSKSDVGLFAPITGTATIGSQLFLVGYGCTTVGGGSSDGKLRGGYTTATAYNGFDVVSQTATGAAVCYGDSGGPALLSNDPTNPKVVALNSKGNIKDTNYDTRTDMPDAQAFFKAIAAQYSMEICGINGTTATCTNNPVILPNDPTSFVATSNSSSAIALAWANGGGSTTGFKLAYVTGASAPANCQSGTVIPASVIGMSTNYLVQSLAASTQYAFRVCSVNASNDSSAGVTAVATTQAGTPPPDPTSPAAIADSSSAITVTWTSGGGTTTGFKVAYQSGSTAPATCQAGTIIGNVGSYHISSLMPSTQYAIRICATNNNGMSAGVTTAATTQDGPIPDGGLYPIGFQPDAALANANTLCLRTRGLQNTIDSLYPEQTTLVNSIKEATVYSCDTYDSLHDKNYFDVAYGDLRIMREGSWKQFSTTVDSLGTALDQRVISSRNSVAVALTTILKLYEPNGQPVLNRCIAQNLSGQGPVFVYGGITYTGYLGFGETKLGAGNQALGVCEAKEGADNCQISQCWSIAP